ncbi:manganese-dependent inorganic pyrophosphatase [Megalodesulfovibrio gigas]|uniref:inorganic diphosphatase n=1 Tax=Megalodesulfovibrio gigas (strain ATCC 19364 / DSM 1382 / NCIMB 9332 / VKM B-1759) TaxID=1121448 RepID=T2GDB3_MEGG1|nr:manganese-dependent inorganic pyrophosphatase [Megalodesulfovibrio gigas]AGW14159.1 putative manganese-dependent inorganic pyrophosphatase [Megalodesulfovibrio gigas DSM 1382 = ATCC 19364]
MSVLVFGHKSPDTDTVVSAIAVADLKSKLGVAAKPVALGKLNPETEFVLGKFGLTAPEVVESVAGQKVIVVDTTDLTQLPDDIAKAEVLGVVDHHKLGSLTTPAPLEMWVWPVGCTGTIVKAMYDFFKVEVPANIAGALLCAILSDTVIFKSPTCTDADKKACEELAAICGATDLQALGMEMFKVKSAVDGVPARELVFRDYKDFDMSGKKVGIGQLEVVDLAILDAHRAGLAEEIIKIKAEKGNHSVFLLLTDIIKEGSLMLIATDDATVVEKAFGTKADKELWLAGVLSRKKDVVPPFEKAFA